MAITQRDIAEHLGISRSLVGEALRGEPKISKKTRSKVEAAAKQLGYDENSNRSARALIAKRYGKRPRSGILAVILAAGTSEPSDQEFSEAEETGEQPTPDSFENAMPLGTAFLNGIEWQAYRQGFDMYLCMHQWNRPVPRLIRESEVDGIILLSPCTGWDEKIDELKLPTISIMGPRPNSSTLMVDDRDGTRQAVHHLAGLGHRRIAYLGQSPVFTMAIERLAGYRDGMRECKLHIDEKLIEPTIESLALGNEGIERILNRSSDFTAVVCSNDIIAMTAIQHLESIGLRVPDDISVIGFDDSSLQFHFRPALTSVGFDRAAMGRRAVSVLHQQIERESSADPSGSSTAQLVTEVFKVNLVVRDSTAAR